MNPTVMHSSREKTLLRLLFFVFLAWLSCFMRSEIPPTIFWLIEVASGWMVTGSLWLLFRPYRMRLDDVGITVSGGFRWSPKVVRWQDVAAFTFASGYKGAGLGLIYKYDVTPGWWWGPFTDLPTGWRRSEREMADILNEWRLKAK